MDVINRFDKVYLIKETDRLKEIGKEYEVGDFGNNSVIIRDIKTKIAQAIISIDVFDKYFIKGRMSKWTPWIRIIGTDTNELAHFYKTNGKRVIVKTADGKYRGKASCNKMDEFDLDKGIKLAAARCDLKYLEGVRKKNRIDSYRFDNNMIDLIYEMKNLIKNYL